MKKTTNKENNDDVLDAVYILVNKKKYHEARILLGKTSEDAFIKALPVNQKML